MIRLVGRGRPPGGLSWAILSHGPPGGRALPEGAPDKKSQGFHLATPRILLHRVRAPAPRRRGDSPPYPCFAQGTHAPVPFASRAGRPRPQHGPKTLGSRLRPIMLEITENIDVFLNIQPSSSHENFSRPPQPGALRSVNASYRSPGFLVASRPQKSRTSHETWERFKFSCGFPYVFHHKVARKRDPPRGERDGEGRASARPQRDMAGGTMA
jgi:hypothetical protein